MKNERILNVVLGAIALVLVVLLAWREDGDLLPPAALPAVEVRMDTVWVHDTLFLSQPGMVNEVVRMVPAEVDTAALLASFYAVRTYADTVHLQDVATVYLSDTVTENALHGRLVSYDLALMQPRITYIPPSADTRPASGGTGQLSPPRLALSLGTQLGSEQAALVVGLRLKRAELGIGYDLRLHAPSVTLKYDIWQWQ
ncbi:MAG: hypothetical protein IKO85_00800 [Bacteroidaceae bacterium]|nr:hypothetical protein [Bacteroidaceae bacterium]